MKKLFDWMNDRRRSSYFLMLVVGAYLFYAIYKMYQGLPELDGSPVPIYIFMGLFALAGAALAGFGLFALIGGRYKEKQEVGGADGEDDSEDENEDSQ